jgi:hypothetical protein
MPQQQLLFPPPVRQLARQQLMTRPRNLKTANNPNSPTTSPAAARLHLNTLTHLTSRKQICRILTCCKDEGTVQHANYGKLLAFVVLAYLLPQLCHFILHLVCCEQHPLDVCKSEKECRYGAACSFLSMLLNPRLQQHVLM